MSVTFSPATADLPHTYGVTCHAHAEPLRIGGRATYAEGQALRARHLLICESCRVYGCYTEAHPVGHDEAPSVNVSNSNAYRLLRLLGLAPAEGCEPYGTEPAAEVLSRAEAYLTLSESPAIAWDEYGVDRITRIAEVARYAEAHGLALTWG